MFFLLVVCRRDPRLFDRGFLFAEEKKGAAMERWRRLARLGPLGKERTCENSFGKRGGRSRWKDNRSSCVTFGLHAFI